MLHSPPDRNGQSTGDVIAVTTAISRGSTNCNGSSSGENDGHGARSDDDARGDGDDVHRVHPRPAPSPLHSARSYCRSAQARRFCQT